MEGMGSKSNGMFSGRSKKSVGGESRGRTILEPAPEEWEIRPGGMLVQKRESGLDQNSATIKVRVKHGSNYHEIRISCQASFRELKKILAERTGLHHEDQKLIYKKKERDSKAYLDIVGVKDGSKMVLVEDLASRERRCLEVVKNAKIEKATNSLSQIRVEVDKFAQQVVAMEARVSRGSKVAEADVAKLIGLLMTELVKLDELAVNGELKLQKQMLERRAQKCIETLDVLKLQNAMPKSNPSNKIAAKQQEISVGQGPNKPAQKQQVQEKRRNSTEQITVLQQQPRRHSESFTVSTKWETFD